MKNPNHLISEKSPYLLQHAYNPVNWYPWGKEAFDLAHKSGKAVFLSIGYATCHWCHVMEKESFENAEIAVLLNDAFIAIKVDREERPDIDQLYMKAAMALNGGGGWPLNLFLTPDQKPFYAATYIPPEQKWGRPGMKELIPALHNLWLNESDRALHSANQVVDYLQQSAQPSSEGFPEQEILTKCTLQLKRNFDPHYGGFGDAPKFPSPHNLLFLLRSAKHNKDSEALEMVCKTLEHLSKGGIRDHLGQGFARYSTDHKWLVPHFEKMLYDQAMIIMALTETYQNTKNQLFKDTALDTISYVVRDMQSSEGGYFSAEDADSEGEEGKYYVWTRAEVLEILGREHGEVFCKAYDITEAGNFSEHNQPALGRNILNRTAYADSGSPEILKECQRLLLQKRNLRIPPLKDDKVLTDWNGMMISALAKAAFAFNNTEILESAKKAAGFILKNLSPKSGQLLHRYRDGDSAIAGMLEDYAWMISGLIDLFQAGAGGEYLEKAQEFLTTVIEEFRDPQTGVFYTKPLKNNELITTLIDCHDGAFPCGNSVMAMNLLRMGDLLRNLDYHEKADHLFKGLYNQYSHAPLSATYLMCALDRHYHPGAEIVLCHSDKEDARNTPDFLDFLRHHYEPNLSLIPDQRVAGIATYALKITPLNNKTTAYVCHRFICKQPTSSLEDFKKILVE
jgi:uncharacterized protein YyaL (SSP411 family)